MPRGAPRVFQARPCRVVDRHGYDGLVLTTLLAGAMLIGMGVARLGRLSPIFKSTPKALEAVRGMEAPARP